MGKFQESEEPPEAWTEKSCSRDKEGKPKGHHVYRKAC